MLSPLPPAQRLGACFAHFPSPIRLPRSRSRVGLRIVLVEACSAFTRVTACTLALSPIRDTLHQRPQPFRYLHSCSGCFRLERLPGGTFTPRGKRRLCTAPRSGHSDHANLNLVAGRQSLDLPDFLTLSDRFLESSLKALVLDGEMPELSAGRFRDFWKD